VAKKDKDVNKDAKQTPAARTVQRITAKDLFPAPAGEPLPFLGHARAVNIVCHCAGTSPLNLDKTLSDLALSGLPFQMCVFGSVKFLNYDIPDIADIPDGPDTQLIEVVDAIQNAQLKG
jgi:hypothetical protein